MQGNTVDFLHTVGNTDSENQKRHQHRVRVDTKTNQMHQAQLPNHRHQGGGQYGNGAAHTPGEPVQQYPGDAEGDGEEHHHHHQTIDQVADLLGKTDNVNFHIGILCLEFGADFFFQQMGELLIVDLDQLALILRVGKRLQQRHINNARLEVVRHKTTNLT